MIVLEYRVKGLIGSLEVFSLNTNSFRPCGYSCAYMRRILHLKYIEKGSGTLYHVLFCS